MDDNECRVLFENLKQYGKTKDGKNPFITEWTYVESLGKGTFGKVCWISKTNDMGTQESALKIIPMDPVDIDRYKSELKTLEIVKDHPHAVKIEDFSDVYVPAGAMSNSYLMVRMEKLNGLPKNGLGEDQVIKMGIDIADILMFCHSHSQKLLHRDIKPDNILVSNHGEYKLTDFGIAKMLENSYGSTRAGTPLYMAPEVHNGQRYNERSDLYSLGITMYTMLNGGKTPFEDVKAFPDDDVRKAEAWRRRMTGERFPQIPGASDGLQNIIWRLCDPDPGQRYESAQQLIDDLRSLQGSGSIALPQLKKNKVPNYVYALIAAVIITVIVSGVIIHRISSGGQGGSGSTYAADGESVTLTNTTDPEKTEQSTDPDLLPPISDISVGDSIDFGSYPQTEYGEVQPIEWRVLAIEDGNALLISEYLLDAKPYNVRKTNITWEDCSLREWLNNSFYYEAFSAEEQSRIVLRTNKNPDDPNYGTEGGNTTEDKVFCLSADEVKKYFSNSTTQQKGYTRYLDRITTTTPYASKNGAYVDPDWHMSWWWLRSPGDSSDRAARVNIHGIIYGSGSYVDNEIKGVRPAILVTLSE